jgi:hypothetical protein
LSSARENEKRKLTGIDVMFETEDKPLAPNMVFAIYHLRPGGLVLALEHDTAMVTSRMIINPFVLLFLASSRIGSIKMIEIRKDIQNENLLATEAQGCHSHLPWSVKWLEEDRIAK